jgi:soluble cytochrome b562
MKLTMGPEGLQPMIPEPSQHKENESVDSPTEGAAIPGPQPEGGSTEQVKKVKKAKKVKKQSKTARWTQAAQALESAVADARRAIDSALEELRAVQEEYNQWRDNLPENLQSSALAEKLDTVCELDLDTTDLDDLENIASEAVGADLPQGFGRD